MLVSIHVESAAELRTAMQQGSMHAHIRINRVVLIGSCNWHQVPDSCDARSSQHNLSRLFVLQLVVWVPSSPCSAGQTAAWCGDA